MKLSTMPVHDPQALAPVRVSHPELSLWQSSVRHVVASHFAKGDINSSVVSEHPLVVAADQYAGGKGLEGGPIVPAWKPGQPVTRKNLFEVALTYAGHLAGRFGLVAESIGHFNDLDPLFVEAIFEFAKWYWLGHHHPQYRDWEDSASGLDFGVVQQRLPADARIGVIGDWGTGLGDAAALLRQLIVQYGPATVIHVGDVYYSGTPEEARYKFTGAVENVLAGLPPRQMPLSIYTIPGNHDYYSGGGGFYQIVDSVNEAASRQAASYFCLRTTDDRFQMLGIDTGYFDRVPGIAFNKVYRAPTIHDSEARWALDKLAHFPGRTILFSHNQLFSAHSALNGPGSGEPAYLNRRLLETFRPSFATISAWFWGHEHSLMVFEDETLGLHKGRLIGCSAFETGLSDDPYAIKFPEIAMKSPPVVLQKQGKWFNHGCALIDLGTRSISYLQIAAWIGRAPEPEPRLELIYTEPLD
jgi:hypothetical protein